MLDESTSQLIGSIYDGIEDERLWHSALDRITQKTGSRLGFFTVLDTKRHELASTNYYGRMDSRMADAIADYEQQVHRVDPTFAYIEANPHAGWFDSRCLSPVPEYSAHPYIRWSDNGLGTSHWITAYTPMTDGLAYAASLHTATADGPHDPQSAALLRMLFEHLARAMRIAARPPMLECGEPALILQADGKLVRANIAADAILREGNVLVMSQGTVLPANPRSRHDWNRALANAAAALVTGAAGGMIALGVESVRWFGIVQPMPAASLHPNRRNVHLLLRLVRPDDFSTAPIEEWRTLFGLTRAEAHLATALLTPGATLRSCATASGITYATARVHLARIFAKTEVSSQAELVMLLQRLWLASR